MRTTPERRAARCGSAARRFIQEGTDDRFFIASSLLPFRPPQISQIVIVVDLCKFYYQGPALSGRGNQDSLPPLGRKASSHCPTLQGLSSARRLQLPANVVLLPLPPYSPELNPIERLWRDLKDWLSHHTPGYDLAVVYGSQHLQSQLTETDSVPLIQASGELVGNLPDSSGDDRVGQMWWRHTRDPLRFQRTVINASVVVGIG